MQYDPELGGIIDRIRATAERLRAQAAAKAAAQQQAVSPDDPYVEEIIGKIQTGQLLATPTGATGDTVMLASQCPPGTRAVGIGFNPNAGPYRCTPTMQLPTDQPTIMTRAKAYVDPTYLIFGAIGVAAIILMRR